MAHPDPLQNAGAAYAIDNWTDDDWRQFGRQTGTSDIITGHSRLLRSLSWNDEDYPDHALTVMGQVLSEAVEEDSGEAGRMELLAGLMPDLPAWIEENAPARTKRLLSDYLAARDTSEVPIAWRGASSDEAAPEEPTAFNWGQAAADFVTAVPQVNADLDDGEDEQFDEARGQGDWPPSSRPGATKQGPMIFIVHGHDEAARDSIRIFTQKVTGTLPISLAEEAGKGQTIIEKFESYGTVTSYVIVLLTPDDVGQKLADYQADKDPDPRARQNVILELGYFIGKIGRRNIIVVDAGVENPSDLAGIGYVQYPENNWKESLRTELMSLSQE
ncbi:nucleotide-binding protein [Curtobacterium sp. A7_M15]|uniref:TIR domain-containing protein n=1 Tax=Curtobacterium sp. A7_M15 TaxID=3065241 RepID=UPI002737A967|nr:TIR domain-containing protein [Curtobacterium sp. A7_M15]MDP4331883.1 nucleotide-binding protein [Curtobacterium sp. A7_M15]